MQAYSAMFDASVEAVPQSGPRGRSLTFEVAGEGNLPHVVIARPTVRNKRGQPLLVFPRCVVGRVHTLPVVIVNDGTLTCKVGHCRLLLLSTSAVHASLPLKHTQYIRSTVPGPLHVCLHLALFIPRPPLVCLTSFPHVCSSHVFYTF